MTAPTLNLCLDLNIWCAAFLADQKGRSNTASQSLVDIVRKRRTEHFSVQLVISWGMLNRLRKVLEIDLHASRTTAEHIIKTIAGYAHSGPHLTLGGTNIIPIPDAEDAHVFDTALAGQAHLLVTANFDDFTAANGKILMKGRVGIIKPAKGKLVIAHPFKAAEWLRKGVFPDVKTISKMGQPREK
jgi:predicted nucleic acid-binding protein